MLNIRILYFAKVLMHLVWPVLNKISFHFQVRNSEIVNVGTGYWLLVTGGYWILVAGYWIYWLLVAGYWILDTGCWILDTGYWLLVTGYWILDT
jgi:hypothetical protein